MLEVELIDEFIDQLGDFHYAVELAAKTLNMSENELKEIYDENAARSGL